MKIHLISDLHVEHGVYDPIFPDDADVILVAGDVGYYVTAMTWLEEANQRSTKPVIFVPGNHEFYDANLYHVRDEFERHSKQHGYEYLDNKSVVINGVKFIGATYWTDMRFKNWDGLNTVRAPQMMNDYVFIAGRFGPLDVKEVLFEHKQSYDFVKAELSEPFDGKKVVITHHAPSEHSWTGDFNNYTPYYVSNDEGMILDLQPDLWVHGHVHKTKRYNLGKTLVATNPRGRWTKPDRNAEFDPQFIIDLEKMENE